MVIISDFAKFICLYKLLLVYLWGNNYICLIGILLKNIL